MDGDLQMPDAVASVAALIVGQNWPKGSETGLRQLGEAWGEGARQLRGLSGELGAAGGAVLDSVGGRIADEFRDFVTEMEKMVPGLAESAGQMSDLSGRTALQVEYAKAMIITQSILVFLQILHFLLFALPEAVPVVVAGGRAIVTMLVKNLLVSVGSGVALNLVSDVLVQVGQFIAGHRHEWDKDATVSAVESGAIGGAVGGLVFGAGRAWKPRFAESLGGKLLLGGVTGGLTEGITYAIWGDETSAFGSAITSGVIGVLEGGRKFRFAGAAGGAEIHVNTHVPHLPGIPDVGSGLTTEASADAGAGASAGAGERAADSVRSGEAAGSTGSARSGAGAAGSGTHGTNALGLTPGEPASAPTGASGRPGTGRLTGTAAYGSSSGARTPSASGAPGAAARSGRSPGSGTAVADLRRPGVVRRTVVSAQAAPAAVVPADAHGSRGGAAFTQDGGPSGITTLLRSSASAPATLTESPTQPGDRSPAPAPVGHTGATVPAGGDAARDVTANGRGLPTETAPPRVPGGGTKVSAVTETHGAAGTNGVTETHGAAAGTNGVTEPRAVVEGRGMTESRAAADPQTATEPRAAAERADATGPQGAVAKPPADTGPRATAKPHASDPAPPALSLPTTRPHPEPPASSSPTTRPHPASDPPAQPSRAPARAPEPPPASPPASVAHRFPATPEEAEPRRPLALGLELLHPGPGREESARIDALAADVAHDVAERDRTGRPLPEVTYTVHRAVAVAGQRHFGRSLQTSTVWAERIRTAFEWSLDARQPGLAARLKAAVELDAPGEGRTGHAVIAVREARLPDDFLVSVKTRLRGAGGGAASAEGVLRAVQELERTHGAAFTRMDVKARAEATAWHLVGVRFGGLRAGAQPEAGPSSPRRALPHGTSHEGPPAGPADRPAAGPSAPRAPRPAAETPRPVPVGEDLNRRRPPWIDRELPPPARNAGQVRFTDGSRLPSYLTGEGYQGRIALGAGRHEIRGADLVVREAVGWLEGHRHLRPASGGRHRSDVRGPLTRALAGDPGGFIGGTRTFDYETEAGLRLRMVLTARPHGVPERFTFGLGNPAKIDVAHRVTQGGGRAWANSSSWGVGASVGVGPAGGVAAGWFNGFARAVFGRSSRFGTQNQTVNQTETRSTDASHVHLDALEYEFRITDRAGRPVGPDGRVPEQGAPDQRAELRFSVRDGLSMRLADFLTSTAPESGPAFPDEIPLADGRGFHEVSVEDVVVADPDLGDRVLRMLGTAPGAKGAEQITGLLSAGGLRQSMRSLLVGPVLSPVLFGGSDGHRPLGVIRMEIRPDRLEKVGPGTTAAEIRDIAQSAVRAERSAGTSRSGEAGAALGPGFTASLPGGPSLRVQVGGTARVGAFDSGSTAVGSAAGIRVGAQAKGVPTALYRLHAELTVTGPARVTGRTSGPPARGDSGHLTLRRSEPRAATLERGAVSALVRLPIGEAERLTGRGEVAAPREGGPVPKLITGHSLGVSRVHEVRFPDDAAPRDRGARRGASSPFTEQVLRELDHAYPDMVASLAELYPANPRWTGGTEHFLTVLHNTREILERLSHQSLTANLGAMLDTGLRMNLDQWTPLGRRHVEVRVDAALTTREYLGRRTDQRSRFSAPGAETVAGQRGGGRSWQVGIEGTVSVRDRTPGTAGVPLHAETLAVGGRYGRRTEAESGYALSGGDEITSITTGGMDWYRYGVRFTVSSDGHWRPRRWMRGLPSGGLLDTQAFVLPDGHRTLVDPAAPAGDRSAGGHGHVVLSVPVEHTRPPAEGEPDGTVAAHATEPPAPRPMTAEYARAMALGSREWLAAAARDVDPVDRRSRSVLGYPHTTVDITEGPLLAAMAARTVDRATRGAWGLTLPGTEGRTEWQLILGRQNRIAGFPTTSTPLGGHWTLSTETPYLLRRTTMLAYRTRLLERTPAGESALTVVGGPVKMEVEGAVSANLGAWGRNTRTSTLDFGGRVSLLTSHRHAGVAGTLGLSFTAGISTTRSALTQRSVADVFTRKAAGDRHVLVRGPLEHAWATASSQAGTAAHGAALVPASLADAHGERHTSQWVGIIPVKAAYELGVLRDEYGGVPWYDESAWSEFPWLRQVQFGGWPVNSLNPAGALLRLDERLGLLNLKGDGAERLRRMVSGRVIRALGNELAGPGVALPARIARWTVGGRDVQLKLQLVPMDGSGFHGLDHGAELEHQVLATDTVQQGRGRTLGRTAAVTVSERADTGSGGIGSAGPAFSESAATAWTAGTARTDTTGSGTIVTYTDLHAVSARQYELRITLVAAGAEAGESAPARHIQAGAPAGSLTRHVPISLMRPAPQAGGRPDPLAPAPLEQPGRTRRVPLPAGPGAGAWRDVVHLGAEGGRRPFEMPAEGFAVRGFHGLEELRSANVLALGAAYDSSLTLPLDAGIDDAALLAKAHDTPLTRIGTGPRESLETATSGMALTALFGRTLSADGYQVPGLEWRGPLGGAGGRLDLYSRPDFGRARLLTVADGMKFETPAQHAHGEASTFGQSGSSAHTVDAGPAGPTPAGSAQGGGGGSRRTGGSQSVGAALDGFGSVNLKPDNKTRAYLYALPVRWLSVARVHHDLKDAALAAAVRGVFHAARREAPAMETETTALVWVREDVALRLGLLDDTNHPPAAREAWNAVQQASAALVTADKALWDLRLGTGAERATAWQRSRRDVTALAERDVDALPGVREAQIELTALMREQAEDDAEADHEEWGRLRDALVEEARGRLARARQAAADELTAAETAEGLARAAVDEVAADLRALHDHGRALHTELARLRRGADRLTAWHQLDAAGRERLRREDVAEPDPMTFAPPQAPALRSTGPQAPKAAKPKPAPVVRTDGTDGTDGTAVPVRPAHAAPPWRPRPAAEGAEPAPVFDTATDHRTLAMTDTEGGTVVYDLHRPYVDREGFPVVPGRHEDPLRPGRAADGNGFWAAVGMAGGDTGRPRQLAHGATGEALSGHDPHVDPQAVFHLAEVEAVAADVLARNPELRDSIRDSGGRLPVELGRALTPAQRRALLRTALVTARRWDARTAELAAALAARHLGRDLIVVEEDGSHRRQHAAGPEAPDARPALVVHRRGDAYLAAIPRRAEPAPAGPADPPGDPARRAIREGKRRAHDPRDAVAPP
ncbi:hypothetical protein [Streptomyces sp. NPDC094468]|uniref:WXG100-like domain-containing protein n=1 Tax=Streptomyces sp. NPDC094468 TaxID=3366066 RepID=UPI00380F5BFE